MSARQGSAVPCRLLHTGHRCCRQAASQVSHTATDGGGEHSLCTAPWSGTLCRTTSAHSRTMSPVDRAWKPGFSPATRVFSALETFVITALYKSTFTIPYRTILWIWPIKWLPWQRPLWKTDVGSFTDSHSSIQTLEFGEHRSRRCWNNRYVRNLEKYF